MLESIAQLVRKLPEVKEEEYIEKIMRSKVERKVRNWKNYIIEILDKEPRRFFIPGKDQKDLHAFQREVIDAFIEHYIIPKQEKGGHFSFYGIEKIESQNLSLNELKEKEPELWVWLKDNYNFIIEKTGKKEKKTTIKILRIPVPKLKNVMDELQKELSMKEEKGECLICLSNKELTHSKRLSKIFGWLIKADKNIAPIYSHSGKWYEQSIRICTECAKKLETNKHFISLEDTNLKLLNWKIKIFPYFENEEEYNDVCKFWEDINREDNLDSIIENYIIPQMERISERIFLNLVFFRQEKNKQDIVMEKTKLSNLIQAYKIFKEWRESEKIEKVKLFAEKSILSYLKNREMRNESFFLDLIKKIIRLERIDNSMEFRLLSMFNKTTQKNILDYNLKEIRNKINAIKFIQYYNERIS
ncbi:MAG: hypothetical protein QXS37_03850 [Candidatus Aenigmatarchaeota archaeon]